MAGDHHPLPGVQPFAQPAGKRGQGVGGLLGDRHPQVAVVLAGDGDAVRSFLPVQGQAGQLQAALTGNDRVEGGIVQEQFSGGRMGQGGDAAFGNSRCNLFGEADGRAADRLGIEHDQQAAGGIVEDRFQAGMQQRLEVFDTVEVDRILQVGQDAAAPVGPDVQVVAALFQARRDIGQHLVRQQDLPRGEQDQFLHRLQRTLGERVEGADGLDRIAEKLDPDRRGQVGGEDVQDAAPHRKGAAILHQGHIGVAHLDQSGQQVVALEILPGHQVAGGFIEGLPRQNPLQGRCHRQDHDPGQAVLQAEERIEACAGDVGMGRGGGAGLAVPGRENQR